MREQISWLVYGPYEHKEKLGQIQLMSRMLAVSKIRNQKNAPSPESLWGSLMNELAVHGCHEVLQKVFTDVIDLLMKTDESIAYFVLFLTKTLKVDYLVTSLAAEAYDQCLVAGRHTGKYEAIPGAKLNLHEGTPWLPWDIKPALENEASLPYEKENKNVDWVGEPLTAAGQLSKEYMEMLRSQKLRLAKKLWGDKPLTHLGDVDDDEIVLTTYEFARTAMLTAVAAMFRGVGSDIFQQNKDGSFYLQPMSEVRDGRVLWQLQETAGYLNPVVDQANKLCHQIKQFFSVSHRGIRMNIIDSCRRQIDTFYHCAHDMAKKKGPMLQILMRLMDIRDYLSLILMICTDIIETDCPEIGVAMRLANSESLAQGMPKAALRSIQRDAHRYLTISLSSYLKRNRYMQEAENEDYIERFCGKLGKVEETEFTSVARVCQFFRTIQANLYGSPEFDEIYLKKVQDLNFSDDLEDVLQSAETLSLREMLGRILSPLNSSTLLNTVVDDLQGALLLIATVFLPVTSGKLPNLTEINAKRLKSLGISKRHSMNLKFDENSVVYEAPEPLSLIINSKHTLRIAYIREQYMLLREASDALLQINVRSNAFVLGEERVAYFRRAKMMRVVSSLVDHITTMVRHVWKQLQADLAAVSSLNDVINAQRRAMRQLIQRTLLETKNRTTVRIINNISDCCSRFVAAFALGDARSCDAHFEKFDDQIRVLCERMAAQTDNTSARVLLVQMDCWDYMNELNNRSRFAASDAVSFISLT